MTRMNANVHFWGAMGTSWQCLTENAECTETTYGVYATEHGTSSALWPLLWRAVQIDSS